MKTISRISMNNKVDIDEFLILMYWVKTFFEVEQKTFVYQNLLDQAETYKYGNSKFFDTRIHHVDDLMIDAYKIYSKLKMAEDRFEETLNSVKLPFNFLEFDAKAVLNEAKKFISIVEKMMETCRYEDPEICGIQKGFLAEKLAKFIIAEEYENAAEMRDFMLENKMYIVKELNSIEKESYKVNMTKFITAEEYEKAAKMRDIINEL